MLYYINFRTSYPKVSLKYSVIDFFENNFISNFNFNIDDVIFSLNLFMPYDDIELEKSDFDFNFLSDFYESIFNLENEVMKVKKNLFIEKCELTHTIFDRNNSNSLLYKLILTLTNKHEITFYFSGIKSNEDILNAISNIQNIKHKLNF